LKVELNKRRINFNRSKFNSSNRLYVQHVVWHILYSILPDGLFIGYESRNKTGNTRIHVILKRVHVTIVAVENQ